MRHFEILVYNQGGVASIFIRQIRNELRSGEWRVGVLCPMSMSNNEADEQQGVRG